MSVDVGRIDRLLSAAAVTGQVPGIVAVAATGDEVAYEGAFGRRLLPDGKPMTLDTIFWIASMTKAVTAVAAMQLVEQGRLSLDAPAGEIAPQLKSPQVLEGFDAAGKPKLRPAKRPVTLRHLLTHTSGYAYEGFDAELLRYAKLTGLPSPRSCKLGVFDAPLMFDPGDRWQYGIGIDWVGRLVEMVSGKTLDAYMADYIFGPLGMSDTGYRLRRDQRPRMARMHARGADGSLTPVERESPRKMEFIPGGGGLLSTGRDYLIFLRMLMNGGRRGEAVLLQPETVELMAQNHIGDLKAGTLRSALPAVSNDMELFPGMVKKWGLSFLINTEDVPGRRSAGSLAWAGLGNTYFWLDLRRRVAGVVLTQIQPFCDPIVLGLLDQFEAAIYRE